MDEILDYDKYFNITNFNNTSIEAALEHIAILTDISFDLDKKEGLHKAIQLANELMGHSMNEVQRCLLYYFLGNAWSNLRHLMRRKDNVMEWEQKELENEIISYRRALNSKGFRDIGKVRQCQILVNLGGLMDCIGRFIDSLEYRNEALRILPFFSMALGNKGLCLFEYGNILYDEGHKIMFFKFAHSYLKKSLSFPLHPSARSRFVEYKKIIESLLLPDEISENDNLDNFSLGDTDEEIKYRKWCLNNHLFLNPLNDLGPYPIADRDVLSTPPITTPIGEGPYYIGYFNQLKQEFISARYIFYESINSIQPHFSDKDTYIFNTYDFPVYSLASEKMKIAFRLSYSIFDKIAYFLNHYLGLSIQDNNVSFKNLWYVDRGNNKKLRKKFRGGDNWPLRGLFWLSKDLYEDKPGYKATIDPNSQKLLEIRNNLEHKYFKLHSKNLFDSYFLYSVGVTDTLAYSMHRNEFEEKTLKLIKLVRSALIYLSLAIYLEELKHKKTTGQLDTIDEELELFDDDTKV